MSRAFTKEIDDAPAPPKPERPISAAPNLVTPRGARLIDAELAAIDDAIAAGRGELDDLQRDQRYWSARKASMQVVDAPSSPPTEVGFGTTVSVRRRGRVQSFTIVGEDEADPAAGLIAWTSPLARALADATAGEVVPFGEDEEIAVLSVSAAEG